MIWSGIKYVQGNFWPGIQFTDLELSPQPRARRRQITVGEGKPPRSIGLYETHTLKSLLSVRFSSGERPHQAAPR